MTVECEIDPRLAAYSLETDGGKLMQILLNLVSNLVKFTKPDGYVRVAAELHQNAVAIIVRDNGIGIAKEDIATVLTPFGQVVSAYNAREGFGLGLPLSKKLAERLGGALTIESTLGEGTTVHVWLPLLADNGDGSATGHYVGFG